MTEGVVCSRRAAGGMLPVAAAWLMLASAGLHAQTAASPEAKAGPATGADTAQAQSAPEQLPKFDVASVKAHHAGGMNMMMGFRVLPDGVSISGMPLGILLRQAFGVPEDQILNEPDWVKSDRYDIEAKVDPDDAPKLEKLTKEQRFAMLLPVLEDRFGLKYHTEKKDLEVYDLVVAKGGPKLKAAKPDDGAGGGMDGEGKMPPPGAGDGAPRPPRGGIMMRMSSQGMTLEAPEVKMDGLAGTISMVLGATVVDKTGLKGAYDCKLTFAPEMNGDIMGMPPQPPPPGADGSAPPPQGPSIFSAVQEQLGLKLEAHKEPVDVIVIDHIQQPSAN